MDMTLTFFRFCFGLFAGYTLVYALLLLASHAVSVFRLSHFEANLETGHQVMDDALARNVPVSIIIPAYNEASCICDTVSALRREDYPQLEIIVVSDGSSDDTEERLIQAFGMEPAPIPAGDSRLRFQTVRSCFEARLEDKRLVLLCKNGGGKGDALNCGFACSRADYCVVVDADTRVRSGSVRMMAGKFLTDSRTVVCAGAVGTRLGSRRRLSLMRRMLVWFQRLEYYRTFYVYRLFFDALNANVIVSGAFAMFDRELVIQSGGYKINTIGEDMELTMRLHAFCLSQHRDYRIAYIPEARCDTQVPFRYRDFFRQRRRWHIGLTQSLNHHLYMVGRRSYGMVGTLSVLFVLVYEFLAPFIELFSLIILLLSHFIGLLNFQASLGILAAYVVLSVLTQSLLLSALRSYRVEPIRLREHLRLMLMAAAEWCFFHPINIFIKLVTFLTYRQYRQTWTHIRRIHE